MTILRGTKKIAGIADAPFQGAGNQKKKFKAGIARPA
jgi:hypothetical protein